MRIFLNTKGKNADEVPAELIEFLRYVENTTDEAAADTGSERIRRIHDRVCKVKTSEEMGVKYMHAWEEKYYVYEEGRHDQLLSQIKKKLDKGRSPEQIADELEEKLDEILELIDELEGRVEKPDSVF